MRQRLAITIAILCSMVAAISLASVAESAEFTVDERSGLHYGCSAFFGAAADVMFYNTPSGFTPTQRVLAATVAGQIPGLFKETVMDAYIDYGDHAFNILGAFSGALAAEYLQSRVLGIVAVDGDRVLIGMGGRF